MATSYALTGTGVVASSLCAGPDGNLWVCGADNADAVVWKVTTAGTVTKYVISSGTSIIFTGICVGSDNNLWVVGTSDVLYTLDTSGSTLASQTLGAGFAVLNGICAGPDGNLWTIDSAGTTVYQITTGGTPTLFFFGTATSPNAICAGSDGNLWIVDSLSNVLWQVTPLGSFTQFSGVVTSSACVCAGSDGNLWAGGTGITQSTTLGVATNFTGAGYPSSCLGICAGPDSNLWATDFALSGGDVYQITPSGVSTPFSGGWNQISAICTGPDNNIWFLDQSAGLIWKLPVGGGGGGSFLPPNHSPSFFLPNAPESFNYLKGKKLNSSLIHSSDAPSRPPNRRQVEAIETGDWRWYAKYFHTRIPDPPPPPFPITNFRKVAHYWWDDPIKELYCQWYIIPKKVTTPPITHYVGMAQQGQSGTLNTFSTSQEGNFRVANNTKIGWNVYIGLGVPPDLTNPTFSTVLPINVSVSPPLSGTLTVNTLVRVQNAYGLESQNQQVTSITIDSSGNPTLPLLAAPVDLLTAQIANGAIAIQARYPSFSSDPYPATYWKVWVETHSIDPVMDTPVLLQAVTGSNLNVTVAPFSANLYFIGVALYRSADTSLSPLVTGTLLVQPAPTRPIPVASGFQKP